MKNNLKTFCIATIVALFGGLMSCKKDFLEITPKGSLIAQKTNDYHLLLNNLDLLNILTDAQVPMGDEIAAVEPFFSGSAIRTQRLFRWDDVIYEPDQDATEMTVPMRSIYLYNKVINEVMTSTEGTEAQKRSLLAEAQAGRAWTYFLLINYYGKPYSSTAPTDPGYPIVKEADVTQKRFTRASVQEVYDFILSDLQAAIPNLPAQTYHRLRMSKAAGEALLGKAYAFMGKYDLALPQLNAAISDMVNAPIPVRLYDYNVTFGTGGSFLPIGTFGPAFPTIPNNEENLYAKQFVNTWAMTGTELVITPQTVALYATGDLRRNWFKTTPFPSGAAFPAGTMRRIGPGSNVIGLLVPDIYLLRAECKARLGDLAGAKADVELLRAKRMPAAIAPVPASITSDQTAMVRFILEERIREFAAMGYRWFDMRRLYVDPVYKNTVATTHYLYNTSGTVSTFTLKPERLVLRFPQKVIDQNPGMLNNQ